MATGLISWGRFIDAAGNRFTVPAPPNDAGKPWIWRFVCSSAGEVGTNFDVVQVPSRPVSRSSTGAGCDGYDVLQRRNLNGTRCGSFVGLVSVVAALNANNCETAFDLDIIPATNTPQPLPQRVYCANESEMSLRLSASFRQGPPPRRRSPLTTERLPPKFTTEGGTRFWSRVSGWRQATLAISLQLLTWGV